MSDVQYVSPCSVPKGGATGARGAHGANLLNAQPSKYFTSLAGTNITREALNKPETTTQSRCRIRRRMRSHQDSFPTLDKTYFQRHNASWIIGCGAAHTQRIPGYLLALPCLCSGRTQCFFFQKRFRRACQVALEKEIPPRPQFPFEHTRARR